MTLSDLRRHSTIAALSNAISRSLARYCCTYGMIISPNYCYARSRIVIVSSKSTYQTFNIHTACRASLCDGRAFCHSVSVSSYFIFTNRYFLLSVKNPTSYQIWRPVPGFSQASSLNSGVKAPRSGLLKEAL